MHTAGMHYSSGPASVCSTCPAGVTSSVVETAKDALTWQDRPPTPEVQKPFQHYARQPAGEAAQLSVLGWRPGRVRHNTYSSAVVFTYLLDTPSGYALQHMSGSCYWHVQLQLSSSKVFKIQHHVDSSIQPDYLGACL
jgi:hypothetical protein